MGEQMQRVEKPDETPSGCGLLIGIALIIFVLYILFTSL